MNIERAFAPFLTHFYKGFPATNYYSYKYYSYRNGYYSTHNILKDEKDFSFILERMQNNSIPKFESSVKIMPLNVEYSFTKKEVIKQKGKPRFVLDKDHSMFNQQSLFYKSKIGVFSFISQFHFIDDHLWLIKLDISFSDSNLQNFNQIKQLLLKKYFVESIANETFNEERRISDDDNNHMLIKNGFKTEIIYYHDNSSISTLLNTWIHESENLKVLADKTIEQELLKNL